MHSRLTLVVSGCYRSASAGAAFARTTGEPGVLAAGPCVCVLNEWKACGYVSAFCTNLGLVSTDGPVCGAVEILRWAEFGASPPLAWTLILSQLLHLPIKELLLPAVSCGLHPAIGR